MEVKVIVFPEDVQVEQMNSNIQNLLPKIVSILNEYGVDITILRDVYENECGVKTLKQQAQPMYKVKAVIDNSKASGKPNNNYKVNGVVKPQLTATVYIAYDSKLTPAQLRDQVTSPGGTTIRGVEALEKAGFRYAIIDAVNQANQ